jgi:hypothetical protein
MTPCVCQYGQKAAEPSKSGKLPTTRSSLPSRPRSQLRICNLCSLYTLCSLGILCNRRSRARLPVRRSEPLLNSPCRRHRTLPS